MCGPHRGRAVKGKGALRAPRPCRLLALATMVYLAPGWWALGGKRMRRCTSGVSGGQLIMRGMPRVSARGPSQRGGCSTAHTSPLSPRLCMVPSPFQLLHHSWARSIHLLLMGVTDRQTDMRPPPKTRRRICHATHNAPLDGGPGPRGPQGLAPFHGNGHDVVSQHTCTWHGGAGEVVLAAVATSAGRRVGGTPPAPPQEQQGGASRLAPGLAGGIMSTISSPFLFKAARVTIGAEGRLRCKRGGQAWAAAGGWDGRRRAAAAVKTW